MCCGPGGGGDVGRFNDAMERMETLMDAIIAGTIFICLIVLWAIIIVMNVKAGWDVWRR